jgi:hypothetical protein
VTPEIGGEHAPAGEARDDLIPAARVKSGGMAEKERRTIARPFPHRQFHAIHGDASPNR